jgi:CDP-diacylglycerol--serine O-phosphatidyltransferase
MELYKQSPRVPIKGRFRRGVYVLPSIFTVGTLVCGYYAVLETLRATGWVAEGAARGLNPMAFDNAAKAIGLAIVFDGLDGRIARLFNLASDFGGEFDSLADVITFGMAPAFLAFAWGVRAVDESAFPLMAHHLRQMGWIVTFAYVICGAARLARFNIDSHKLSSDRRYFVGLPIPAAAGVVAAIVHAAKSPLDDWRALFWLAVVGVVAFLMVSRVRYYSFKALDMRRRRPYIAIIFIGLIFWAVWAYSEPVLLVIAVAYALSGPFGRFTSRIRPQPPAPEEAHAQ